VSVGGMESVGGGGSDRDMEGGEVGGERGYFGFYPQMVACSLT